MRYISNTPAQQKEMLAAIGASSIEDLLVRIPTKARLSRPLNLPRAMAETELVRHLQRMAGLNAGADEYACFLGAGSYDHAIPSPINHLISRGEFFTAYTPYQPEASQGTLRSIFEYQTMMAELCGMDVANASIYDGASSLAEATLMAHATTGRDTLVISRGVNPLYRQVVETYVEGPGLKIKSAPLGDGVTDPDALDEAVAGLDSAIGLDRLRCLHVNDADAPLGSNRDRHASLGLGVMKDGIGTFVAHPAFDGLPAILETRGPDGTYVGELAQLRELRKKGRRRLASRRRRKPA